MSMTGTQQQSTTGQMTGRKLLFIMIAFFGVIIAVNLTLTVFALNTDTGLVVRNSYVASQDFNRMQSAANEQEKLGWRMDIGRTAGALKIEATGSDGTDLAGLTIKGTAGRPVSDFQDRELTFVETSPGSYSAPAELGPGDWQVDVTARDAEGNSFRRIYRIDGGTVR